MPHVNITQRFVYKEVLAEIQKTNIMTKGDLEFLVYNLAKQYMSNRDAKYSFLHDAVYGVIHAGEEFKRLHLDKREDVAIKENGEA